MYPIVFVVFLAFSTYLLAHFGGKVMARDASSWWAVLIFLFIGVLNPSFYSRISAFLGISVVSNFVFAAMIVFLFKVSLENACRNTQTLRKLRDAITSRAAEALTLTCEFQGDPTKPRVLIAFPTFNEASNIAFVAEALRRTEEPLAHCAYWTCCFVNDGSTDGTKAQLGQLMPKRYVSHDTNLGVSAVLLTAFKAAEALKCDYIVQCDADGQHPIDSLPALLLYAVKHETDLLIGSRFLPQGVSTPVLTKRYKSSTTLLRRIGGYMIGTLLGSFGRTCRAYDPTSGFRVYSRRAAAHLAPILPDDYPEPESIALCGLKNMIIAEMPVTMQTRHSGITSIHGLKSLEFMIKVSTALLSLRVRSLFP